MSALAEVVNDIRKRRVVRPPTVNAKLHESIVDLAANADGPLVDATFIYDTYIRKPEIAIYEDHPSICPPWTEAFIGYRNEHGNANITYTWAHPWEEMGGNEWESEHGHDLSEAKWCLWLWMFSGGRAKNNTVRNPTCGPIALTQIAVAEDGTPIDIHWTDLMQDGRPEQWDWSRWAVLGTYNFLNMRNIDVVEARLPKPEWRAERRLGIRSHVLTVKPTGKSRTGSTGQGEPLNGVAPLHSVRGHMAHYGQCCRHHEPRGLLFGRYTCRVWVPAHARGDADTGTVDQTFIIKDDD